MLKQSSRPEGVHVIPTDPPHQLVLPEVQKGVPYLILDLTAQDFMMRVPENPGPGEYAATGNVYRFSAADAGHQVVAERIVARPD